MEPGEQEYDVIREAQIANLVDALKQIVKSPDSSDEARRNALDVLRRTFGDEYVRREFGE